MPNKRVNQINCGVIEHHLNKETKATVQNGGRASQPGLLLMHSKKNAKQVPLLSFLTRSDMYQHSFLLNCYWKQSGN